MLKLEEYQKTSIYPSIYVAVCRGCDTRPEEWEEQASEGKSLHKACQKAFKTKQNITVGLTRCLGGCECHVKPGRANGCCSISLMGEGRYTYVFNNLTLADLPKIEELVAMYQERPTGLIVLKGHPRESALKPHLVTRTPPLTEVVASQD